MKTSRTRTVESTTESGGGRRGAWLWALALLVAVALGALFGRWAFAAPQVDTMSEEPATVLVSEMTVGRTLPVSVAAEWPDRPFGVGAAAGVLTSLDVTDGATVDVGDVLYTVDLRPVVAAVGDVPAFRDLAHGARGDDVAQLQRLLVDAGHFAGPPDGVFGTGTHAAVRAWQGELGVPRDGVVRAGDLVFAAALPAKVRLADDVDVGTRLAGGETVLSVLDGEPQFIATFPSGVTADLSLPIYVEIDGEPVPTTVAATRVDDSGNRFLTLVREDGAPLCAERCDEVPLDAREAVYPAHQVVVPEVTGPGVPAAAVWFTATGEPYLVLTDGTEVRVTIVGQGQGSVVLDGIEAGTEVVLADQSVTAPRSGEPAAPASTDQDPEPDAEPVATEAP